MSVLLKWVVVKMVKEIIGLFIWLILKILLMVILGVEELDGGWGEVIF